MGFHIRNTFICFADIDFECPHCKCEYNDKDEIYLKRCERNKSGYTKKKCSCGKWFGVAIDMTGDIVGFKL